MATIIQDFETDVSGWSPVQSDTYVAQVPESHLTNAVRIGSNCMMAAVDGVENPSVSNSDVLTGYDLRSSPYICIDVLVAGVGNTSDVKMKFEYTCNPEENCEDVRKEESQPVRIHKFRPRTLFWRMDDLPDPVLKNPQGIAISWETHPQSSSSTFSGAVAFDNLRIVSDPRIEALSEYADGRLDYSKKNGGVTKTTPKSGNGVPGPTGSSSDGGSTSTESDQNTGTEDGPVPVGIGGVTHTDDSGTETESPYAFLEVGQDKYEATLCGTSRLIGGGWK